MTFHVDFDEASVLVTVSAIGHTDKDSWLESLSAVRMHPRFQNGLPMLCSFLDQKYLFNSSEWFDLGLTLSAFFRGQQIALVVHEKELTKVKEGIAIFSTGRVAMNVFADFSSARSWLRSQREAIAA